MSLLESKFCGPDFSLQENQRESARGRKDRYAPPTSDQAILSSDKLCCDNSLASGGQAPATGSKGLVQYPAVLNLRKVDDTVGLDLNIIVFEVGVENGSLLGRKGRRAHTME